MIYYGQNPAVFHPPRSVDPAAGQNPAVFHPPRSVDPAVATVTRATPHATGITLPDTATNWCKVCDIGCNSKDMLDNHKLGKKHKRNLEKLNAGGARTCIYCSETVFNHHMVGRKHATRMKMLNGRGAAEAARTCTYCNVVCNSEPDFNLHMAGRKHATMMKKYAEGNSSTEEEDDSHDEDDMQMDPAQAMNYH